MALARLRPSAGRVNASDRIHSLAAGQPVHDQRADDGDGERVIQQRQAEACDDEAADQWADREAGIDPGQLTTANVRSMLPARPVRHGRYSP